MRLDGKNMIVTGASQGIGKAIAIMGAAYGANICAVGRRLEPLLETKAEIEKLGRKCIAISADVTDYEAVKGMVKQAEEDFGKIDVLVNNVGWDKIEPFLHNTPDFWDKAVDVNYKSVIYCSRAVLDGMIANNSGTIINISSDAGRGGSSGETVYAGTKGAVIAFTKSLAREVARYNINVNCVCPGPTKTPLFERTPEKLKAALERAIPMRRVGEPEEVAGAAIFFASDLANYITGQVISVSGGLTMHG